MKLIMKYFAQSLPQETHSDISDPDESDAESNQSYFQFASVSNNVKPTSGKVKAKSGTGKHRRNDFEFTQVHPVFEPPIAELLEKSNGNAPTLDLREVLLLDNHSTVDIICNRNLVKRTFHSKERMHLKSNGGILVVNKKAELSGHHSQVWYNKNAIANIISLYTPCATSSSNIASPTTVPALTATPTHAHTATCCPPWQGVKLSPPHSLGSLGKGYLSR
jgi:hypothetical protein